MLAAYEVRYVLTFAFLCVSFVVRGSWSCDCGGRCRVKKFADMLVCWAFCGRAERDGSPSRPPKTMGWDRKQSCPVPPRPALPRKARSFHGSTRRENGEVTRRDRIGVPPVLQKLTGRDETRRDPVPQLPVRCPNSREKPCSCACRRLCAVPEVRNVSSRILACAGSTFRVDGPFYQFVVLELVDSRVAKIL